MATTLTKLKGFIQTYLGPSSTNFHAEEREDLKGDIEEMSQLLIWEISEDVNAAAGLEKHTYIESLVAQLTYISDGITGFDKEEQSLPLGEFQQWVLYKIAELLEHTRSYFAAYFNFERELPSRFLEVYRNAYPKAEEELTGKMAIHDIDPDLAKLIIYFSQTPNGTDRFRIRTWRQWDHLQKTVREINHFLDSPAVGITNLELLKLLVAREFNSIQVYGYFVKYIEKTTLGETSFPEQQQELLYLLKTFRQVRVEAESVYNPTVQSLKLSVIESLEAELTYLEQKEKLYLQSFKATNPEAPSKFYFKVAVTLAELMFFFRVMLEVGVISTKFNSYLYEFISNHIQTERAENISKKSMRNHINNKPFPDRVVQNVKSWLDKMTNHIDLYYKL
ncbi:hypothetical protein [uncultured Mucilaginibacter sp.]|uniref:hypothetical protein n=1 Tax=uncultured Mucilaginibacter sp. TaxID=797541 RepID=UPI0025DAA340|nr:hypothetical protein [uncultured Mucilaginibacter sp.]